MNKTKITKHKRNSLLSVYCKNGLPKQIAERLVILNIFIPPVVARLLRDIVEDENAIRVFLQHPGRYNAKRFHWIQQFGIDGYREPNLQIQLPIPVEIQLSDIVKLLYKSDPRFFDIKIPPIVKQKETAFELACRMSKCDLPNLIG